MAMNREQWLRLIATHVVAFLLGFGVKALLGDREGAREEAHRAAQSAASALVSAAHSQAEPYLQGAPTPIPEVASAALPYAQSVAEDALGRAADKLVDSVLPEKGPAQYTGDWVYSAQPDSKYTAGTLLVEAGRKGKEGVKDTPYNITFRLTNSKKQTLEGGCGFYESGQAFCRTDTGDPTQVLRNSTTVQLKSVGKELVLDIEDLGISEHFKRK